MLVAAALCASPVLKHVVELLVPCTEYMMSRSVCAQWGFMRMIRVSRAVAYPQ